MLETVSVLQETADTEAKVAPRRSTYCITRVHYDDVFIDHTHCQSEMRSLLERFCCYLTEIGLGTRLRFGVLISSKCLLLD